MQAVRRCFHCLELVVALQQPGATKVVHEVSQMTMASKPYLHAAKSMTVEDAVNQAAEKYMLDPRAVQALVEKHSVSQSSELVDSSDDLNQARTPPVG